MKVENQTSLQSLGLKEKIQLAGTVLFTATLPLFREMNQAFYILFIFSCLPLCRFALWKERRKIIIPFICIYLVTIISGFYAPDKKAVFSTMEVQLSLLLTPVIFGISYIPSRVKNHAIKVSFVTGVCTSLACLFVIFLSKMWHEHLTLSSWLQQENLNHRYSSPIGIHATFFSTYIALCSAFIIELMGSSKKWLVKIFLFLLLLLCIVSLLFLSSRIVLIVYGICVTLFILFSPRPAFWPGKALIFILLALILGGFIHFSSYFKARFDKDIEKDLKWSEWRALMFDRADSTQQQLLKNDGTRIERWIAAVQVIRKKPLIGYGTGQEKPVLFKKYRDMNLTVSLEMQYDAHNQFFSVMIKSGFLGLFSLLLLFYAGLRLSIRHKDLVYLFFLLIVFAVCLVENYLNANKGVFFFSFFNIFFAIILINTPRKKNA